jgi:glycopeptide antibiotics resistance protein
MSSAIRYRLEKTIRKTLNKLTKVLGIGFLSSLAFAIILWIFRINFAEPLSTFVAGTIALILYSLLGACFGLAYCINVIQTELMDDNEAHKDETKVGRNF